VRLIPDPFAEGRRLVMLGTNPVFCEQLFYFSLEFACDALILNDILNFLVTCTGANKVTQPGKCFSYLRHAKELYVIMALLPY